MFLDSWGWPVLQWISILEAFFMLPIDFSILYLHLHLSQFSSVAQSCPTLCDPMNHSTPGLPVHHQLPELLKLMYIELVMPSSHLILCHHLLLLSTMPPSIRAFTVSQLFTWGSQSIEVSASASVLPMNIQDFFPLGWTCWISLQSK